MMLKFVQLGLHTGSGFASGERITGSDLLYGFFILISPFIYAYYRDKRDKAKRRRERNQK